MTGSSHRTSFKTPTWYEDLALELGREPEESDLMDYALHRYGESLFATMTKDEMIAAIDQFPPPKREC